MSLRSGCTPTHPLSFPHAWHDCLTFGRLRCTPATLTHDPRKRSTCTRSMSRRDGPGAAHDRSGCSTCASERITRPSTFSATAHARPSQPEDDPRGGLDHPPTRDMDVALHTVTSRRRRADAQLGLLANGTTLAPLTFTPTLVRSPSPSPSTARAHPHPFDPHLTPHPRPNTLTASTGSTLDVEP